AGMTREEFQHYWRYTHGPLVASVATDINLLRYVQVHTLDDPMNEAMNKARGGEMEAPYDGVAELWWENEETFLNGSEAGQAAGLLLLEDEQRFIDLPNSPIWVAREYPQVNPTPENIVAGTKTNIVKIHFPLRHVTTMDEAAVRDYWLQNHGPIIRSHAQASGILRYIQVHRLNHPVEAALREARGTTAETYLGHAEVWVSRDRNPTPESRAASAAAVEDESHFIDFSRSAIFAAKEHVIVDRRG
ncbi:MAG: EthD domain-containing protein, partial [Pseudomonadales bacterium]|nr:EthD domain-containing protein [Pseudomonadales bacterium]